MKLVTSALLHRHAPLYVGFVAMVAIAVVLLLRAPLPAGLAQGHALVPELTRLDGCVRCHTEDGIDPGCLACHDEIQAQLDSVGTAEQHGYHAFLAETADGEQCTTCHLDHFGHHFEVAGDFAWKDLDRDGFDHPHLDFTLVGAHDALECDTCHAAEFVPAVTTAEFPELARMHTFLGLEQDCMGCHEDPHAGGLSPTCTECHDQNAFSPVPHFDHDEHFELGCAHDEVDCAECHEIPAHTDPEEMRLLPFDQVRGNECLQCHETPHRIEFSVDCWDCHTKQACLWNEGRDKMTPTLHEETGFAMGKAHADVACDECHSSKLDYAARFPDPTTPGYARTLDTCEGCHDDIHQGQFEGRYSHCRDCHADDHFIPGEFSIADHAVWPLEGSHLAVLCGGCHVLLEGRTSRRYVDTPTECADCHRSPHLGQFDESAGDDCQRCHSTPLDWKAPGFDHDRDSRFPLDGDHVDVPCADCHRTMERPDGDGTYVHYRPLGRECQDCHERPVRKP